MALAGECLMEFRDGSDSPKAQAGAMLLGALIIGLLGKEKG